MFIEGYIDREYLRMLRELGYDVVWEIKDREDAISKGYDEYWPEPDNPDTVARIFIDEDLEDVLTPEVMGMSCNNMLPLMAMSTNERIRAYAAKQLEKE